MKNSDTHEIIINKKSFDILSADTSFYSIIGKRLYYTFDRLVFESDLPVLVSHIKECNNGRFIIRILSEENECLNFFARVSPTNAGDQVAVRLMCADELVESDIQLRHLLNIKNKILELYNDDYFEYCPEDNLIKIYSINKYEQEIDTVSFDEFEKNIRLNAGESEIEAVDKFISAIKSGNREFELCVEQNIIDENTDADMTVIKGSSIYVDGKYYLAVGYIHLGSKSGQNVRKKIEVDSLTGLIPKAEITNTAISIIDINKTYGVTIAIADIDYFKEVNDTYGHMTGDEVLKKVADIIEDEVGDGGLVGRIGGDEFFIIFYDVADMENARERIRSIKNIVNSSFPANEDGKPSITLSIGCAAYPKDAENYEDLFTLADFALYRAKEKGRNRYIIFDERKHGSLKDIKKMKMTGNRINNRGDMSMGDILCVMMDKVYSGAEYPIDELLDDVVVNFGVQRIMVYAGTPYRVVCMAGEKRPSAEIIKETENYINNEDFCKMYDKTGMLVIDDISIFLGRNDMVYEMLNSQDVLSFIQVKAADNAGNPVILSIESVNSRVTWNRSHQHLYRLLARLFSEYTLV